MSDPTKPQRPWQVFLELARDALGDRTGPIQIQTAPAEKGDLMLPCFSLAKTLKKAPSEIASGLAAELGGIADLEVSADGGFLNFRIADSALARETIDAIRLAGEEYGRVQEEPERLLIEHTSANPTGPLHVGRARNPFIGDTLARIHRLAGDDVETQFYLDDIGRQALMMTLALRHFELPEADAERRADYRMISYYQKAVNLIEEEPGHPLVSDLEREQLALERGETHLLTRLKETTGLVMEGMRRTLAAMNVTIDSVVRESRFIEDGSVKRLVERFRELPEVQDEDGALWFDLAPFGASGRNTRFFLTRQDGTSLYSLRDLAYHAWKAQLGRRLINVLGEDHRVPAAKVDAGLSLLGIEPRPEVVFYSFVSLPEGRLSTRQGRVVFIDDLLDEAVAQARTRILAGGRLEPDDPLDEVARRIGVGAVRFHYLGYAPEKRIEFSWDRALSFEGESAPFVQYAAVRAKSILERADLDTGTNDPTAYSQRSARGLVRQLAIFPEVVASAATDNKTQGLTRYLYELAQAFNQFYRDQRIMEVVPGSEDDPEGPKLRHHREARARVALVAATLQVLRNGLWALGIEIPKRM